MVLFAPVVNTPYFPILNMDIKPFLAGAIKDATGTSDLVVGEKILNKSGLKDTKEVQEVLDYLCDHHYLAVEVVRTAGRTKNQYWVNPAVFTC